MGKLTQGIHDELTAYFRGDPGGQAVSAQSYEPRGSGYDPTTDARLAGLVMRGRTNREWARVKRVVDELAAPVVEVLRLAIVGGGVTSIAARLPSALEQGRALALAEAREVELQRALDIAVRAGLSGMAAAVRVLEVDARIGRVHVTPREVERATVLAVTHGQIDVYDEANAVIDRAVDAYVAAREALKATKRAVRARHDADRAAYRESLMAAKERRRAERFERKLRGAV